MMEDRPVWILCYVTAVHNGTISRMVASISRSIQKEYRVATIRMSTLKGYVTTKRAKLDYPVVSIDVYNV